MRKIVGVLAIIALLSAPALAQTVVSATNPVFTWTGKEGDQAAYSWSASVSNPSKRSVTALISLHLIDSTGAVVASDSKTVVVDEKSVVEVDGTSRVPYSDARRATQYRITVEGVEN